METATLDPAGDMILWNALLAFRLYRKLGIRPMILGETGPRIISILYCHG